MTVARRYEDLDAWQLADALKREVYALIESGPASKDFKFRDQIRDSAASATRNISEGFGRFRPADFARFLEFAVASLMETQDSLKDGVDRGYFRPDRVAPAQKLAERSIKCATKFIVYLKGCGKKRRRRPRNDERRTKNPERRTKNNERRTKNDEPRTKNDEPRTKNDEPRTENDEPRTENDEPRT